MPLSATEQERGGREQYSTIRLETSQIPGNEKEATVLGGGGNQCIGTPSQTDREARTRSLLLQRRHISSRMHTLTHIRGQRAAQEAGTRGCTPGTALPAPT